MKKFITRIIVVLFTILIVSLAFDFAYTYIYKNSNPRSKFQYLRSLKNTKINYIFLGSSRVDNGIVPSIIENKSNKTSLNLGFQYSLIGDIYYSLKLLKEYNITKRLRNMKRNKYLKCINLELFQFQKEILKNFKF